MVIICCGRDICHATWLQDGGWLEMRVLGCGNGGEMEPIRPPIQSWEVERLWKYLLIVLLLLIMFRAKLFKSHRIILAGYQEQTARARIWTVWQPQIHYFKQIYSNQWPRKGNRNPGREHKGSVHNKCNVHFPRELAAIIRAWAHFGSYYQAMNCEKPKGPKPGAITLF